MNENTSENLFNIQIRGPAGAWHNMQTSLDTYDEAVERLLQYWLGIYPHRYWRILRVRTSRNVMLLWNDRTD